MTFAILTIWDILEYEYYVLSDESDLLGDIILNNYSY